MTVAAAVIEQNGRVLIAQRRRGDRHELKWEFPGGKVEPGETPAQALRRELKEELDIEAEIGGEIVRYEFEYFQGPRVSLIFYWILTYSGEPRNLCFEKIIWEARERLAEYDFLEGDADFVKALAENRYGDSANSFIL